MTTEILETGTPVDQGMFEQRGSIACYNGACFVLEPPFQQGGYTGYSSLARITPLK